MKNPGKKEFILKKIPLKQFMSLLYDIYGSGADFVDLHGIQDEEGLQDEVIVSVPISYINSEFAEETKAENIDPPPGIEDGDDDGGNEQEGSLTTDDIINILKHV